MNSPIQGTEAAALPVLPHFFKTVDVIPRITQETFLEALNGSYGALFNQNILIDCRFDYEYNGGHIDGAVNFNDKGPLLDWLFKLGRGKVLLILYCEHSIYRAPLMAGHVRDRDRSINMLNYPHLAYNDLYILEGGYQQFFQHYSKHCSPQSYISMSDERFQGICQQELVQLRNSKKEPRFIRLHDHRVSKLRLKVLKTPQHG